MTMVERALPAVCKIFTRDIRRIPVLSHSFSLCHSPLAICFAQFFVQLSNMRSLTLVVALSSLALSQSLAPPRPSTTQLRASLSADNVGFGVSWDWEQVTSDVFISDQRPIILFDGKCNLCNGGVNFALDHDEKGKIDATMNVETQKKTSRVNTSINQPRVSKSGMVDGSSPLRSAGRFCHKALTNSFSLLYSQQHSDSYHSNPKSVSPS